MIETDIAFAPATELKDLIARKEVSPVEVTELYLSRIDALDSQLNSYLTVTRDEALAGARAAEDAVMRGESLGPLHGLPLSIKDLEMTAGIRTTSGSAIFKDRVPDEDSLVVERVRKAGAVILGKTNTPEFGLLGHTENRLGDHCRNPWNTDRTTGGSSGGAGAATVAGLCSLATGSDGGGSIRIPCSFTGTYGIKPTQGRVPRWSGAATPVMANQTSQSGPMTRTVRDSALLLQVLAGHDTRDAASLREAPADYLAAADRGVRGLRIGWSADFGNAPVDSEVKDITASAARVFEELGCTVEESDLNVESPFDAFWTIFTANVYTVNAAVLKTHRDELSWYALDCIEHGSRVTGEEYARALGEIDRLKLAFAQQLDRYDLILSPTVAVTAFPVGQPPREIAGQEVHSFWGYLPFTYPINMIGHTAASIPCGSSSDDLPVGLHIVGRHGDEATVIAASAAFEEARPWSQRRPPVS